jgi:hypothetical protein
MVNCSTTRVVGARSLGQTFSVLHGFFKDFSWLPLRLSKDSSPG